MVVHADAGFQGGPSSAVWARPIADSARTSVPYPATAPVGTPPLRPASGAFDLALNFKRGRAASNINHCFAAKQDDRVTNLPIATPYDIHLCAFLWPASLNILRPSLPCRYSICLGHSAIEQLLCSLA
jgi:hypothetical protein